MLGEVSLPCMVYAVTQSAGRGQRGNSWESEPGKNITASIAFAPKGVKAREQFVISEAIALATVDFLEYLNIDSKIKWPNDIYVGDKKIAGILIENSLMGCEIVSSVAGVGININQEKFRSDAPNPISVKALTGKFYDIDIIIYKFGEAIEQRLAQLDNPGNIHLEFMNKLWRGDGLTHLWRDIKRGEEIEASIDSVMPDGVLHLCLPDGCKREFIFKEVEPVL